MTVKASFTDEVKAELANVQPARPCCQEAELTAMVEALAGAGDGAPLTLRIPRGTFLARGVLGNPADAYHLEMAVSAGATTLVNSGAVRAGVALKRTTRRGRTVYYLKGAEPISRMLGLMGANRAVMRFENDRILRDMRSHANRRANSETANMDKRLRAALQQREAIRRLKARDNRLQSLPPALREMAELRLAHPRAGLRELAQVAQVSKSAVANRLRRLVGQANRNGLID